MKLAKACINERKYRYFTEIGYFDDALIVNDEWPNYSPRVLKLTSEAEKVGTIEIILCTASSNSYYYSLGGT